MPPTGIKHLTFLRQRCRNQVLKGKPGPDPKGFDSPCSYKWCRTAPPRAPCSRRGLSAYFGNHDPPPNMPRTTREGIGFFTHRVFCFCIPQSKKIRKINPLQESLCLAELNVWLSTGSAVIVLRPCSRRDSRINRKEKLKIKDLYFN